MPRRKSLSRILKIGLIGIAILALVSCDRAQRDIAARSDTGSIAYKSEAHPYAVEGPALVREVLPQGDETISGEALYAKSCSACHQLTGQGVPGAFPPLAKSVYVTSDKTDRLASIILYGLMGPITVNGVPYNNVMAPWGGALNDQELAAIATYIRSAWGNAAPAVGPEVFAAMRTKWGSRPQFKIEELGVEK